MSTVPSIFKKHSQLGAYTETARRTTYLNPLGRTSYAPGQEIVFSLPSSGGWLDCENSYLEFDIQTTNANLRRFMFDLMAGANHIISQVVLYAPNGSIISEMQSYDLYSCIKACQMSSSEFNSNVGANSGASNINSFLTSFDTGILADTDLFIHHENQTISLNLNCLFGKNNTTKMFPLHHMSGECRMHLFLNNTISSCGISNGVDNLTFENVIFRMETVLLPGEVERSFLSEPIKLYNECYAHQHSKIAMGAATVATSFS